VITKSFLPTTLSQPLVNGKVPGGDDVPQDGGPGAAGALLMTGLVLGIRRRRSATAARSIWARFGSSQVS